MSKIKRTLMNGNTYLILILFIAVPCMWIFSGWTAGLGILIIDFIALGLYNDKEDINKKYVDDFLYLHDNKD